jgi:hypothetical protein
VIVFGSILLGLALAALLAAKPWRRRPRHPHCGACRFDLTGLAMEAPCPECGRGPEARRRIARRRTRTRLALLAAIVPLAVVGGGCLFLGLRSAPWHPYAHARILTLMMTRSGGADGDAAFTELAARQTGGLLSPRSEAAFIAALMTRLEDRGKPWPAAMQNVLASAWAGDRLTPEQRDRYLRSTSDDVRFVIRPRTRLGRPIKLVSEVGPCRVGTTNAFTSGTENLAVRAKNAQIEIFDASTGRWSRLPPRKDRFVFLGYQLDARAFGGIAYRARLDGPQDLSLGLVRLRVPVHFQLVDDPAAGRGPGPPPRPIGEPWTVRYEVQTTIVPAEEMVFTLDTSQQAGTALAAALCIDGIHVRTWGEAGHDGSPPVVGMFSVDVLFGNRTDHPPTAATVIVRPSEPRERQGFADLRLNLDAMMVSRSPPSARFRSSSSGGNQSWLRIITPLVPTDPATQPSTPAMFVDVVVVPDLLAAELDPYVESVFAGEITFKRVPVYVHPVNSQNSLYRRSGPCPPSEVRVYTPAEIEALRAPVVGPPAPR